jgi:hypothetical protein
MIRFYGFSHQEIMSMKVKDVLEGWSNLNCIRYSEIEALSSLAPLAMGDEKQYKRFFQMMEELQLDPEQYKKLKKLKSKYEGFNF